MSPRRPPTPTIGDLARAFRTGERSPVDVVEGCLARIAEHDPRLRAFATVTAALARTQARIAAAEVHDDRGLRRPLLGIPIGVKDIVDVAGVPTRAGIDGLRAEPAAADAAVWRRLVDAGAVIVGKTRTDELAYGVTTPPTRHPVDAGRMVGGSSGGSAAALAAGMCLGAVGTDTAGSIRIPAGLCGVVGLKPTRDLCSTVGVLALAPTLDHVGPMARTPGDAAVLLAAMAAAGTVRPVDLDGLRVGLATEDALWTADVRDAFTATADALASAGAAIREVPSPSFADARWHADRIISVEAGVVHADLRASVGDRLSASTRAKLASANRVDGPTYYRALRHAAQVRAGFDAALADVDVLLAPGVASTAPVSDAETVVVDGHRRPVGHVLCWNVAAANLAGLPAVVVPAGAAHDGLPVSVQLIGAPGSDQRLLAIATAVAAAADGR